MYVIVVFVNQKFKILKIQFVEKTQVHCIYINYELTYLIKCYLGR